MKNRPPELGGRLKRVCSPSIDAEEHATGAKGEIRRV